MQQFLHLLNLETFGGYINKTTTSKPLINIKNKTQFPWQMVTKDSKCVNHCMMLENLRKRHMRTRDTLREEDKCKLSS